MRARALVLVLAAACAGKTQIIEGRQIIGHRPPGEGQIIEGRQSLASERAVRRCFHLCSELLACQSDAYGRDLSPDTCMNTCVEIGEPPKIPGDCLDHHSCMFRLCLEYPGNAPETAQVAP